MAKKKRSLADRVNAQKTEAMPSATQEMTAEAQEKALEKLKVGEVKPKKKRVRVSVDFPSELYEQMKATAEDRGQTHRGFIISLVKQHYKE